MFSKVLCKSVFLMLLLSFCSAWGDTNILVNPGFEDGTSGWAGRGCSIAAETSVVNSGSGSAKASGRSDSWQGMRQSVLGKMVPGQTYAISAMVRIGGTSSDRVIVSVDQQDGSGTNYLNVANVTANDSEWVEVSGNFTLNVEGALTGLDVYFEGPTPSVDIYIDDVNVYGPMGTGAEVKTAAAEVKATVDAEVSAGEKKTGCLIENPGFEDGISGWSDRGCSISPETSFAHGGMGCAKAYNRSENWQGIKQSVRGKMIPGESYAISAWVRIGGSASDRVVASVEQQDGSGTLYHNVGNVTANDSEWVEVSGNFTLSTEGTLSVLDVYFEGVEPGVDIYVDDVNVYGLMPVSKATKAAIPKAKAPEPKGTGKIDASARRQKIEGFGAAGAHYTMEFVRHKQKSELYNLLFKELDLDIFRIKNNHDMEPNSFKETVEIVKGGKAALGGDLKIMMTSWSPPVSLKSNDKTAGGTLKKNGDKYMYEEFADWWNKSLVAYSDAGVEVDYVNIQNEPDFEASWDGCRFDPKESASVAGYGAAFEAVWQKLNTEMGSAMPKMLAPETSGLSNIVNYIDNLPDQSHVYGYAHHLYSCSGDGDSTAGCGSAPDRYIASMEEFKSKYGNKPRFQTEYEYESDTWTHAMNVAILMHNSLTVEEAASYIYWELFWGPTSGLVSMDNPSSYTIKPAYYAFKHYSAFIDSGFQRVDASSDNSGLRISAYASPDGKKLTVVIINTTTNTDIELKLALENFSISKGEVYRSSETEKCVKVGSYDGNDVLKLPAYSITTLSLIKDD